MPKIRTYTSPMASQGLQPSDLGIRATEEAARAMGSAGRSLGASAEDIAEPLETSALSTEYAQTTAQLSQDTNAFFKEADPNDPDLYNKYKEKVLDPTLAKFGSGPHFSSKAQGLAQAYRNDLEQNYSKTALGDQSSIAGAAVETNLIQAGNALSQGAYADPTQHAHFQDAWNNVLEMQIASHHLTAEQAASVREQVGVKYQKDIAAAAGTGMAERNPDQAKSDFDSGMFNKYLTGQEVSHLKNYADTQQRASDTAQRAAEAAQRKAEDDQFAGQMSDFYTGIIQPDGTMAIPPGTPLAFAKLALTPGGQRHPSELKSAMEMIDRVSRDTRDGKTIVTDPHIFADFSHRMNLPDGDPNALTYPEVNSARAAGQLSDRDHAMFRQSISDNAKDPMKRDAYRQFGKLMSTNKGVITHSNILSGLVDSPGDMRYSEYLRYERNQFDQHYKDGTWRKWLDDNGPTKDAVKFAPAYNPNQDMTKPSPYIAPPNMGGGAPSIAPLPGESIAAYKKRTKS